MQPIPIAFQGEKGAYSEQAIREYGHKLQISFLAQPQKTFKDLFEAIIGETGLGMVPIENARAGSVVECYDLFLHYDVEIISEHILGIHHCLLAPDGVTLQDVKTVHSHPQALSQCSDYLQARGYEAVAATDTAGAARAASEEYHHDRAAIASEVAAEEYGLTVLARDIQNGNGNVTNQTRFLLVKKKGFPSGLEDRLGARDKTTVLFETQDIPAALYKCLGGFATNDVNLLKIESRPSQEKNFNYLFYLDFEGTLDHKPVLQALKELRFFSKHVKVLGSYRGAESP